MKYFSLAAEHRQAGWFLNPLTGNLHQTSARDLRHFQTDDLPSKIVSALAYCDHPYRLRPPDFNDSCHSTEAQLSRLKKTYDRIVFLRSITYWLATQYSRLSRPMFENSLQAFQAMGKLGLSAKTDSQGCLNRTLAAAKCSAEFSRSGVLLIGADLPHTYLHAWIIEKNYQPDPWDRDWINYLPIAAYAC